MKQFILLNKKELFLGSDIVRKFTFKTMDTRGLSALLMVIKPHLSADRSVLREESALLQKKDCFECLSLHEPAA